MPLTAAELQVKVGADTSGAISGLRNVQSELQRTSQAGSSANAGLGQISSGFRTLGSAASGSVNSVLGLTGGIARFASQAGFAIFGVDRLAQATLSIGSAMFAFDAHMEQTSTAFTSLLGSAQAARTELQALTQFATNTPFNLPDVENAARQLLAFGFQAQNIIPMLTAVGDAVAAMGGGADMVNRVTLALGQMQAKGKVAAQEMMQLTEAGIPAWDILAQKMGVSTGQLQDMVSKGVVPAGQAITDLTAGMEDRFKGMMDAQSKTALGMISNIKDSANIALGQIMAPAFEVIKGDLKDLQDYLASPGFEQWAQRMSVSMEGFSKSLEGVVRNDGPKLVNTLETAFNVGRDIAGVFGDIYGMVDSIAKVFGGHGWEVFLALYGIKQVAPIVGAGVSIGKGIAGVGTSVLGGGGTSPITGVPVMNVTADVVNVNGANIGSGAGSALGRGATNAGESGITTAGVMTLFGVDIATIATAAAVVAIPLAIAAAEVWVLNKPRSPETVSQQVDAVHRAQSINQAMGTAPGSDPTDRLAHQMGVSAGASELTKNQEAQAAALKQMVAQLAEYDSALNQVSSEVTTFDNKMAELDAMSQQLSDSQTQLTASTWATLEADRAQVDANNAIVDTLGSLADAYQTSLDVQKVFSSQGKEYTSTSNAISDAIDVINKKKAAGLPLTDKENMLLGESTKLQGRLAGGIADATEQQGFAAAASVELMLAQDKLNQLQRDGVHSGADYEQAVKDVQTAQENAKQFGGDPMAAAMQAVHDTITNELVPAIDILVQKLKDIVNPPPIDIQIAEEAAIRQIDDLKRLIESGASMPINVFTAGSSGGAVGSGVQTKEATGIINAPFTHIATVNELGPEMMILPYAGHFAAGGTVAGTQGSALVPQGATIVPADQTAAIIDRTKGMVDLMSQAAKDMGDAAKSAQDYASAASAVVSAISNTYDLLLKITNDKLPDFSDKGPYQERISELVDFAAFASSELEKAASEANLSSDTLDALSKYAQTAGSGVSALANTYDLILKITDDKMPDFSDVDVYKERITELKVFLEHVALSLGDTAEMIAASRPAGFTDELQSFSQAVAPGVTAMADVYNLVKQITTDHLPDFSDLPVYEERLTELKFFLEHVGLSMGDTAQYVNSVRSEGFVSGIQSFSQAVAPAVQAMADMYTLVKTITDDKSPDFSDIPLYTERLSELKFFIEHIALSLGDTAAYINSIRSEGFTDTLQGFAQAVAPAIQAESDVYKLASDITAGNGAAFANPAQLAAHIHVLSQFVGVVADTLGAISEELSKTNPPEWTAQLSDFAQAAQTAIGADSDVFKLLSDMTSSGAVAFVSPNLIQRQIRLMADFIEQIADTLDGVAQDLAVGRADDWTKGFSDFAQAVQSAIGADSDMYKLLQDMQSGGSIANPEHMKLRIQGLTDTVELLAVDLSNSADRLVKESPDIVQNLSTFTAAVEPALSGLTDVMAAFDAMRTQSHLPKNAATVFDANMKIAADAMRAGVKEMADLEADGTVAEFRAIVTDMADAFQAAFSVFGGGSSSNKSAISTSTGGGGGGSISTGSGGSGGQGNDNISNVRAKGPAGGSYDANGNPDPNGDFTTIVVNGPLTRKKGAGTASTSGNQTVINLDGYHVNQALQNQYERPGRTTILPYGGVR